MSYGGELCGNIGNAAFATNNLTYVTGEDNSRLTVALSLEGATIQMASQQKSTGRVFTNPETFETYCYWCTSKMGLKRDKVYCYHRQDAARVRLVCDQCKKQEMGSR